MDFRLKSNRNDQLVPPDQCSSEYVAPRVTRTSGGDSDGPESSTHSLNVSYNVNNIYVIGEITNASVVKLGESSVGKSPVTNKKKTGPPTILPDTTVPSVTSSEQPECNVSDVKPTKTRMPEYFENAASTQTSPLAFSGRSTAVHRSTDNTEITCHCPSKTEE